jgi:hypothetical protein
MLKRQAGGHAHSDNDEFSQMLRAMMRAALCRVQFYAALEGCGGKFCEKVKDGG